ncbi:hypothetical protein [Actinomyces sp.]|uniref:hypothetical protein n=1 Tax=Actinomyces sp. TaxID=29317 RepID=UPI0026DD2337|nr:hypothetical protein [Actinomyces sp.]MDO4899287.1 hypothetical protein [Actinomyces sp.]
MRAPVEHEHVYYTPPPQDDTYTTADDHDTDCITGVQDVGDADRQPSPAGNHRNQTPSTKPGA